METWKPVVGYEGFYEVSDAGRVRAVAKRMGSHPYHILKPYRRSGGYSGVCLYRDGRASQLYVHTLVAKAFLGGIPEGMEPNHKDFNKTNNSVSNIEFLTHVENCRHAFVYAIRHKNGRFKSYRFP